MSAEAILSVYERAASDYIEARDGSLFERPWLDRMLALAPGKRLLDLGCGSGEPLASYLSRQGCDVVGVDGAAAMLELFRAKLPAAGAVLADMRTLRLGRRFDMLLAWDSLFHLRPDDQRGLFPVLARHADPGAVLMFTTGHEAGETQGELAGHPLYHASLDPEEYRDLLAAHGFSVSSFVPRDPACGDHSVWLTRSTHPSGS